MMASPTAHIDVEEQDSVRTALALGDIHTAHVAACTARVAEVVARSLSERLHRAHEPANVRSLHIEVHYGIRMPRAGETSFGFGFLSAVPEGPPDALAIRRRGAGGFLIRCAGAVALAVCVEVAGSLVRIYSGLPPLLLEPTWPTAELSLVLREPDLMGGCSALEPILESAYLAVACRQQGGLDSDLLRVAQRLWKLDGRTYVSHDDLVAPAVGIGDTGAFETSTCLPSAECFQCGARICIDATPEHVGAACGNCRDVRCPSCGGPAPHTNFRAGDAFGATRRIVQWCRRCRVSEITTDTLHWRRETLRDAAFWHELECCTQSAPRSAVVIASRTLCSEIDKLRNAQRESDLFLLALHLSEATDSTIRPWDGGWCLEHARRSVRLGCRCQVDLVVALSRDTWHIAEGGAELDEPGMIERMRDWLAGEGGDARDE